MKKRYMVLVAGIIATLSFGSSMIIANAREYMQTTNLFDTKFVTVESGVTCEGDIRAGTTLQPQYANAKATLSESVAGDFALDYNLFLENENAYGVRSWELRFHSIDTKQDVCVRVDVREESRLYQVVANDKLFTINGEGVAVKTENSGADVITFHPETLEVKVNGDELWDFSNYYNGSYTNDFILHGFSSYDVEIAFIDAQKDGGLIVYELNNQPLEGKVIYKDVVGPTIYASSYANGLVGEAYKLPKPYGYDVMDGEITDFSYEILLNGQYLETGVYEDGIVFTPSVSGTYVVNYCAEDSAHLRSTKSISIDILDDAPVCIFEDRGSPLDATVSKGSSLSIPRIFANSNLANGRDSFVGVSIYDNGKVDENYQDVMASGFEYTFQNDGIYSIVYKTDFNGIVYEYSYQVTVLSDVPVLSLENTIPENVSTGENYFIPNAVMRFNGVEKEATKYIVFPSGAKYKANVIKLTEYGFYKLVYSAEFNGTEYTEERWLRSVKSTGNLFGDNIQAEIGQYTKGNDSFKGVVITESIGKGGAMFSEPINVTDFKKENTLIELVAYPYVEGTRDYAQIVVTLTDINDPNNYIAIKCQQAGAKQTNSYVQVSHNGQKFIGADSPGELVSEPQKYGYNISHNFLGTSNELEGATLKISMDYKTKRIYCSSNADEWKFRGLEPDNAVIDLDDLAYYTETFKGFSDGKCYVSVSAGGFVGTEGRYIIRNIANYDFTKEYLNYENPILNIDYEGNDENIPQAVLHQKYPLFTANAKDILGNDVKVVASVYYNYGRTQQFEVDVKDGAFIPKMEGEYVIEYKAQDGLFNRTISTVKVNAKAKTEDFRLSFAEETITAYAGAFTALQELLYVGNHGKVRINNVSVKNNDSGEELEVVDGGVIADKLGTYTVNFELTDYLGRTANNSYRIVMQANPVPVFNDEVALLPVYKIGNSYTLPLIQATDFSGETAKESPVSIKVMYQDGYESQIGSDRVFTPIAGHGDNFTVIYQSRIGNGESATLQQTAKLVEYVSTNGQLNISDYFAKTNVAFTANSKQQTATVIDANKPASFAFAKPLSVQPLDIQLKVEKETNAFSRLRITLTDSIDLNRKLVLEVSKNNQKSHLSVNGGAPVLIVGSFYGNDAELGSGYNIRIAFRNSTMQILDASNKTVLGVTEDALGNAFNGFPSKMVYVDFEFLEVDAEGTASVSLLKINNQPLSDIKVDTIKPEIIVNGSYGGTAKINDVMELPTVSGYDVLSEIKSVSVSVTNADGKPVKSVDGILLDGNNDASRTYQVQLTEFGTYKVVYKVVDTNNNTATTLAKLIYVSKIEAVQYTFNGTVASKGKVNKAFELPTVQFASETSRFNVIIIGPNSAQESLPIENGKLSFIPKKKGKYTARYFIYDEYYNYELIDYQFIIE